MKNEMKKTIFKRVAAVFMVLCLSVGAIPTIAQAKDTSRLGPNPKANTTYDAAYVCLLNTNTNETLHALYSQASGKPTYDTTVQGMSYDKATNTLTMSDYNGTGTFIETNQMGSDFKIELIGENKIDAILSWGYYYDGSVNFTGSGSLTVNPNRNVKISNIYQGIDIEAEEATAHLSVSSETTLHVFGCTGDNNPAVFINNTTTDSNAIIVNGNLQSGQVVQKPLQAFLTIDGTNYLLYSSTEPEDKNITFGCFVFYNNGTPCYTMKKIENGTKVTEVEGESLLSAIPDKYKPINSDYYNYTVSTDSDFHNWLQEVHFLPNGKNAGGSVHSPARGTKLESTKLKAVFTITKSGDSGKAEVAFTKPINKNVKSVTIPATITVDGVTYKVTAIEPKAFANLKNLTTVNIGSNIKTIGANAFYNCEKIKSITIETTALSGKTVGSNAFKGINAKTSIKVPKENYSAYKKLLKARGVSSKAEFKK